MFSADSPVTPRPGESITAAIFRQHDAFHGAGLSATDQTAILADTRQQLADCARRGADLVAANRANVSTIHQLQQALADANLLIATLQDQLESARRRASQAVR